MTIQRVVLIALFTLAGCKDVAEKVTEKSISAVKETTKGIAEGVEQGRKSGESLDGATLVSSMAELADKGSVSVYAVAPTEGGTEVTLAVENTTDKPLRLTKLEFLALDVEGFTKKPGTAPSEFTVAAKAKDKLVLTLAEKPEKLAKIRVWASDFELPKK